MIGVYMDILKEHESVEFFSMFPEAISKDYRNWTLETTDILETVIWLPEEC